MNLKSTPPASRTGPRRSAIPLPIGTRIADESVAIRHLHLRKGLAVHDLVFTNDAVQRKQISSHSVHFAGTHTRGFVVRHGAIDVVPDSGGVGPVASYGLDGL